MAITAENLSVAGVENIVKEGRNAYADLIGDSSKVDILKATLARIDHLLDWLMKQEQNLCNKMGVSDLKEFKNKFNQAVNDLNLYKLTGTELKRLYYDAFKEATGKANIEDKKAEALAQTLLDALMEELDTDSISSLEPRFHRVLLDAVVTETGCKTDLRALTRSTVLIDNGEGPKIINEALTPEIKKRLKILLSVANSDKEIGGDDYSVLKKISLKNFKGMDNPIEITTNSEWYTLIEGLSSGVGLKAFKEQYGDKKYEALIKKVNNKMTQSICTNLGLKGDNEVRNAINAMLDTKLGPDDEEGMKKMFFIGKADKEVIGLLGEIAAYAALKKAFGSKVQLRWAAQALEGGKQLSIDIVLNEMFGIQVKNTTKDLKEINYAENITANLGIGFVDKSAYDVIKQLTDSDALSKAYESSYFNISYVIDHDDEPHVIPGNTPDFDSIANDLVTLRENVKVFLYQFSPEMVFMANDGDTFSQLATLESSLQNLSGNLVYIVGNQPVFASEALIRIRKQIDNLIKEIKGEKITDPENALRISGSHSKNIVNYLNDRADKHEPIGLERQGALVGVGTISLTTSFRF